MDKLQKIIDTGCTPFFGSDVHEVLIKLGVGKGDIIIMHASLSSFGYLIGGESTIVQTTLRCLGTDGTLVMPSQSVELMDPKYWEYPPVPKEWHPKIREEMPPYDKYSTAVGRGLGCVAAYFCNYPGTVRSNHPLYSFCAYGKEATSIISSHPLNYGFSKESPLGRLYELDAKILMLGTDFESNTSLHLAEYELSRSDILEAAPILVNGNKQWVTFKNIELDLYDDYLDVQNEFFSAKIDRIKTASLPNGRAFCFSMRECVDFAVQYYQKKACNSI